jgi:hypothetical protein
MGLGKGKYGIVQVLMAQVMSANTTLFILNLDTSWN